jgi:uncharacterized membrane protein YbhN (UPF0104 family)
MTGSGFRSSVVAGFAFLALSLALVVPLVALAKVDLRLTLRLLGSIDRASFAAVVLMTALNTLLAAEKWRLANAITGGPRPPLFTSFALTAIGVGLGQVLPVQLATGLARVVGARVLGAGTMLRAGATTIYEQAFDVAVFGAVAVGSGATLALRGGASLWCLLVAVVLFLGWLAAGLGARSVGGIGLWVLRRGKASARAGRMTTALSALGEVDSRLARKLFLLSTLRYTAVVGISVAITTAVRLPVSPWQLAAALPFAVIAIALTATPAGIGVNEWAMSGALVAFGIPMHTAVQWVLLSRILSTAASALVGFVGAALSIWLRRRLDSSPRKPPTSVRSSEA